MRARIIAGSRGSRLARVQAQSVITRLQQIEPGLDIGLECITTHGDRDRRTPLDNIGIDVFVKELEEALLDRRIDFAVHSLKDVPTELPPGLCLAAVTPRDDPADVLVAVASLPELPPGSRIGTGSLRRAIQLRRIRPDLDTRSIRGNVDTRLRKVADGELDGVVVAAAALKRLGLTDRITQYLPLTDFLPAAGQGAIVVEARLADEEIVALLARINHAPTWQSVTAERAFLRSMGGGCRAPIAALGEVKAGALVLAGMIAGVTSNDILRDSVNGDTAFPEALGISLAQKMLGRGAARYIAEARSL